MAEQKSVTIIGVTRLGGVRRAYYQQITRAQLSALLVALKTNTAPPNHELAALAYLRDTVIETVLSGGSHEQFQSSDVIMLIADGDKPEDSTTPEIIESVADGLEVVLLTHLQSSRAMGCSLEHGLDVGHSYALVRWTRDLEAFIKAPRSSPWTKADYVELGRVLGDRGDPEQGFKGWFADMYENLFTVDRLKTKINITCVLEIPADIDDL